MRVCKTFSFDASHQLPNHNGKCRNLHGHTYKLEVMVEGDVVQSNPDLPLSDEGMVIDFGEIKEIYRNHLEPLLDHKHLNETVPVPVTTCELVATWIRDTFFEMLNGGHRVHPVKVRLWETPTSYAEV